MPNTEPWGTPDSTGWEIDFTPLSSTTWIKELPYPLYKSPNDPRTFQFHQSDSDVDHIKGLSKIKVYHINMFAIFEQPCDAVEVGDELAQTRSTSSESMLAGVEITSHCPL